VKIAPKVKMKLWTANTFVAKGRTNRASLVMVELYTPDKKQRLAQSRVRKRNKVRFEKMEVEARQVPSRRYVTKRVD
jgi:hypothetical protein